MKKILLIFGTRPEFIKLVPIIVEFRKRGLQKSLLLADTGQHTHLIAPLLRLFDIQPDFKLTIMRPSQSLSSLTARALEQIQQLLDELAEKNQTPACIMAQGDTTSVMAASMAAYYCHIPFAHLEAGLRTHHFCEPFPEELNRRITALCAAVHYAPTALAKKNLLQEGIAQKNIFTTGNTIVDALEMLKPTAALPLQVQKTVLITCHRRENQGDNLLQLIKAIQILAIKHPELNFLWVLHPNPNIREVVLSACMVNHKNIELREPLDYFEMIAVLQTARMVITDSGGLQEEAPSFGLQTLILRDRTERPEAVHLGCSVLVGCSNYQAIVTAFEAKINHKVGFIQNPYGDGKAAIRVVNHLSETFLKINHEVSLAEYQKELVEQREQKKMTY
jgi:UDP-N-acetylglucosamine 2-epimerase (non-hydrolysing)